MWILDLPVGTALGREDVQSILDEDDREYVQRVLGNK
jgi:hypothetical protein